MGFGGSQTWVQVLTLCDLSHVTNSEQEMGMFINSTLQTVAVRMKGEKMRKDAWNTVKCPLGACCFVGTGILGLSPGPG